MIIVKVMGGLGNQMFQIAFAKMLSKESNEELYIDRSIYKKYKIRNFSISNLEIGKTLKYVEEIRIPFFTSIKLKITQGTYRLYQKLFRTVTKGDIIGNKIFDRLSKKGLYYNFDRYYYDSLLSKNKLKSVYGYFQSEKYFEKFKDEIIKDFKVRIDPKESELDLLKEINECNSVGVSLRVGDDYLKSSHLNVCSKDYYYRGMDYIYNKNKDAVFYIFSDDVDRVKKNFKFKYPVKYIEGFNDYESLRLLYTCKHFVISNSSFSWWGAYLSNNNDKLIIAPDRWYNNSSKLPAIYYDSMIRIKA